MAEHGLLGRRRGELVHLDPAPRGGRQHDAAGLAQAQRGTNALGVEGSLEGERGRPQGDHQPLELLLQVPEPPGDRVAGRRTQHAAGDQPRAVGRDDEGAVAHRAGSGIHSQHDRPGAVGGDEVGGQHGGKA